MNNHYSQYCLRWNNHQTNVISAFENLLQDSSFTDVTLAVDSGLTISCHKIVLAASSTYFQTLFHSLSPLHHHPVIILKDIAYMDLKAILEFMYRGEVNVVHNQLQALLKTAEILQVKGLMKADKQEGVIRDTPSTSPPPAISTSTGGCSHSSPPHSTGVYSTFCGKSGMPIPATSLSWQLPSITSHQYGSGDGSGSYDSNIDTSLIKRRKSTLPLCLVRNDTPILRTVLGQTQVDSSQKIPQELVSHESMHYRNMNSNESANDSDNRRTSDQTQGETPHADVSYADEDERQPSPPSYSRESMRNSAPADCVQPKPEWKRYKQYTREDIYKAIEAVKSGESAVQAAKKYGVPSRTLYDKVKKLGIPTSRPSMKRSTSNGGSTACFPYGVGANVNGALYDSRAKDNTLFENENESGSSNMDVVDSLASTSNVLFETIYDKIKKEMPQDRDSIAPRTASPVIRCVRRQQHQQQVLDDQVEDLSVSRKSDVPVIVPPSTTSDVKEEETGLDNSDGDHS
ncbi:PREDICTED: nucleus accumbens-associated protein 1-like [Vollenhovia emeryi]|uniref:nucleus accumbens-associated protein 1-like n=1 Tax=Vollenhovia emeryi TaxID=411798 RepID=UPI0005F4525A|nr:PREDICTED: nucleus accumbens-associated protein 1-like [Vollenhovia emeryi]